MLSSLLPAEYAASETAGSGGRLNHGGGLSDSFADSGGESQGSVRSAVGDDIQSSSTHFSRVATPGEWVIRRGRSPIKL